MLSSHESFTADAGGRHGERVRGADLAGPSGFGGEDASLKSDLSYVSAHGGGTIAVSSQSSAAAAIIAQNSNVAGIGGFSGRESTARLPGDTRTGSKSALSAVEKACRKVSVPAAGTSSPSGLYDCQGRAAQLAAVGTRGSAT
jgi:hypothetical protein